MSDHTRVVELYMQAFAESDHETVLSCLTEDVQWEVPGTFQLAGRAAFDAEMQNPAFVGTPHITIVRVLDAGAVVVAEGTVETQRQDGERLTLRFCDVFDMRDGKIARLTSYLMPIDPAFGDMPAQP